MCGELVQSGRSSGCCSTSFVLHREMERYRRKTVRGIDERKIEGGGAFFKGEARGLNVHNHRRIREEIITSASVGF